MADDGDVTRLLEAVRGKHPGAVDELVELVHGQLHAIAHHRLAGTPPWNALQPTALVHEAYLRLFVKEPVWENRRHFFWAAGRAMRDILVDRARSELAAKRGGGHTIISLDNETAEIAQDAKELFDLDRHLDRLQREHPRAGEVVILRYFAGLTHDETANVMNISSATVRREWSFARAWLRCAIDEERQK